GLLCQSAAGVRKPFSHTGFRRPVLPFTGPLFPAVPGCVQLDLPVAAPSAARRLGNLLHGLTDFLITDVMRRKIRLRDDTDEPLVLDDGHATHLLRLHELHDILHVVVGADGAHAGAHVVADGAAVRMVVGDVTDRDVAVGDDTAESHRATVVDDGDESGIRAAHDAGCIGEAVLARHALRIAGHDITCLHAHSSCGGQCRCYAVRRCKPRAARPYGGAATCRD